MQTDQLEEYSAAHSSPEPEGLTRLARRSNLRLINGQMVSGHLQGRLLKMLVAMIRPKRVLELGTFSGYSALCMSEGLDEDAYIDTIEADDELEDFIRQEALAQPGGEKIRLHIGDALEVIAKLGKEITDAEQSYDLVFIDADKRQYCEYFEAVFPLVRRGGYIIADNTLWYGHVIDPKYDRDRQTLGIRKFNEMIAGDARVEKVMVPMRDGLTIIRKL